MILLDTHAWVWWTDGATLLSRRAADAINQADRIGLSTVSVWEMATLVRRGRLRFDRPMDDWVRAATQHPRLEVLPVTLPIALRAGAFGHEIHGDPADRLILATAIEHGASLLTKDDRLRVSSAVSTVW